MDDFIEEPSTKIKFPKEQHGMTLVGCGCRVKYFITVSRLGRLILIVQCVVQFCMFKVCPKKISCFWFISEASE